MKRFFVSLCVAASLFAGAAFTPGASVVPVANAKPCKSGWVHASLSWGHKCLRAGQFCKQGADREYHRYGFHCHSARLTD